MSRVTNDAIESDNLDIYDFATLRLYFWQVVKERDLEDYLFFGNEEGKFIGVLANQTSLTRITEFLKQLKISPNGQSFIMERSGDLVVSSQISQAFLSTGVV
ncbi:MAG: hypothetical protein QNJ74_19115 [Trichodesmium sp. MO_231.B1]|nr:hypothetical protein [Trichodesmium sp. MO_231.B1]